MPGARPPCAEEGWRATHGPGPGARRSEPMNEREVESLVRSRIHERKASVEVPNGLADQILRSLRTTSPVPPRRLGRELFAAAALIVVAAVIAGGIAWARGYWVPQPAGPSGLAHLD